MPPKGGTPNSRPRILGGFLNTLLDTRRLTSRLAGGKDELWTCSNDQVRFTGIQQKADPPAQSQHGLRLAGPGPGTLVPALQPAIQRPRGARLAGRGRIALAGMPHPGLRRLTH